jgi:peptidoglycan/LPS O-acetylase OafA/YrhL
MGSRWNHSMSRTRRWLVVSAGLYAIAELIDGIVYRIPPGIVFALIVGACAWWASRSHGWAAPAVLLVLALGELLLVVFVYGRGEEPAAWWRLVLYGALSLAVAVIAAVNLARVLGRRQPSDLEARGQDS